MSNNWTVYLSLLAVLFLTSFLYKRYEAKLHRERGDFDNNAIQNYLLSEESVRRFGEYDVSGKPILWIHLDYEYNSRNWLSFGSRSSFNLNQGYLFLTMQSIIEKCRDSFRICIIDDKSFAKLLPGWNVSLRRLSYPLLDSYRTLAKLKLLHKYGGVVLPANFVCLRDLRELYDMGTYGDKMFVVQNALEKTFYVQQELGPDVSFLGAPRGNKEVEQLMDYVVRSVSQDHGCELEFLGSFSRWLAKRVKGGSVRQIDARWVGVKDMEGEVVGVERWMGDEDVDLYKELFGILVPAKQLLTRSKYAFFPRMSPRQVLGASNIVLSKYLLLSKEGGALGSAASSKYWRLPPRFGRSEWF